MTTAPMAAPNRRALITQTVQDYMRRNKYQQVEERGSEAALKPAVITNFILQNLIVSDEQWKRAQIEDPERFQEDLQILPAVLADYLAEVEEDQPLDQVTTEKLEEGKPRHIEKLEHKRGCRMYILRIC